MQKAERRNTGDDPLERLSEDLIVRYIDEVVLAFNLCPWAHRSMRQKSVKIAPICGDFSATEVTNTRVHEVALTLRDAAPEWELVLFPLPRYLDSRLAMDGLLRSVRTALQQAGCESTFALAAFHPAAELDQRTPETMIPYFRRTPLPMIQAVRNSILEAVSARSSDGTAFVDPADILSKLAEPAALSLRAEIAAANARTLELRGEAALDRVFDDLRTEALEGLRALESPSMDRSAWSSV